MSMDASNGIIVAIAMLGEQIAALQQRNDVLEAQLSELAERVKHQARTEWPTMPPQAPDEQNGEVALAPSEAE